MLSEASMSCDLQQNAIAQQKFTEFMHEQVRRINEFRQHLCHQHGCEISHEYAVSIWIERGYAAAFRQRFEQRAEF
jgi:hypothetical protein